MAPDVDWEARAAREERYGGARTASNEPRPTQPSLGWIMGGPLIASFDKGDVRMSPAGLTVYGDDELCEIKLGVKGEDGRDGRINTFYDAIVRGRPLPADGAWGMATLEVILAIEESSRTRKEAFLRRQVPTIDYPTRSLAFDAAEPQPPAQPGSGCDGRCHSRAQRLDS